MSETYDRELLPERVAALRREFEVRGFKFVSDLKSNHHILFGPDGSLVWECKGLFPFKTALAALKAREVKS